MVTAAMAAVAITVVTTAAGAVDGAPAGGQVMVSAPIADGAPGDAAPEVGAPVVRVMVPAVTVRAGMAPGAWVAAAMAAPVVDPAAGGTAVQAEEARAAADTVVVMAAVDAADPSGPSRHENAGDDFPSPAISLSSPGVSGPGITFWTVRATPCALQSCDLGHDVSVFNLQGDLGQGRASCKGRSRVAPSLPGLSIALTQPG